LQFLKRIAIDIFNLKMLRSLLLIGLFLNLTSCRSQPKNAEVSESVRQYYVKLSLQDGGSTYEINTVKILNSVKLKSQSAWHIKVQVDGSSANYSLPNTEFPQKFSETLVFEFSRNKKGKWECRRLPE
jgi:hypothetical protein